MEWDFRDLLIASQADLLAELADTHQNLAVLHEEIAHLRVGEKYKTNDASERIIAEGKRDAFIEKKFLLIRLLETVREREEREGRTS